MIRALFAALLISVTPVYSLQAKCADTQMVWIRTSHPGCPTCGQRLLQTHTAPFPCANEGETHYAEVDADGCLVPATKLTATQLEFVPIEHFTDPDVCD